MAHLNSQNRALVARVRRIAGQIGAVERALENDAGCTEVLHLVAAVRGAVNGLMDRIVEEHLEEHVAAPDLDDAQRTAGAAELLAVMRRYAR